MLFRVIEKPLQIFCLFNPGACISPAGHPRAGDPALEASV
jgi:hypothetical protein